MNINIYEFVNLFTEDGVIVNIFDTNEEKIVFTGEAAEARELFGEKEVFSFDLLSSCDVWSYPAIEINI